MNVAKDGNFTRFYVVALLLIAVLATVKFAASYLSWQALDSFGEAINVSGRQRMLSQKITLEALALRGNANTDLESNSASLSDTVRTFVQAHEELSHSGDSSGQLPLPATVAELYFSGPEGVDEGSRRFAAAATGVAAGAGSTSADLAYLLNNSKTVLAKLDQVVSAFERELERRLRFVRLVSTWAYVATLLLLLFEARFIFRPAQIAVTGAVARLRNEVDKRLELSQLLSVTLDTIDQGIVIFDRDRRLLMHSRGFAELLEIPDTWFAEPRTLEDFLALQNERGESSEEESAFFSEFTFSGLDREALDSMESRFSKTRSNGLSLNVVARVLEGEKVVLSYTDVTTEIRSRREIENLAWKDPLTGLNNRNSLKHTLGQLVEGARRLGTKTAIVLLDLDRFKQVNDTYGHEAGDVVLAETGKRIRSQLRGNDVAFRLGGDEFAVGIDCEYNASILEQIVQRLIVAISRPIDYDGKVLGVGATAGAAIFPDHDGEVDELIRKADTALYEAKRTERGTFRSYDQLVDAKAQTQRVIEDELRAGLGRDELTLYFQGKRRVADAGLLGAEALVRWVHPTRGVLAPGYFISVVERTDLVQPVGAWVLANAVSTMTAWIDEARVDAERFSLAVNVSARQFFDSQFVESLLATAARRPDVASSINLEITEEIMIGDTERVIQIMKKLSLVGYTISMDDFGTGYSSISYLHRLPVSVLKIDRSFLVDIGRSQQAEKIVGGIIDLGRNLGVTTVAEGVETAEQHAFLRDAGCDQMQGFLFDRPSAQSVFEQAHFKRSPIPAIA